MLRVAEEKAQGTANLQLSLAFVDLKENVSDSSLYSKLKKLSKGTPYKGF